VSSLVSSVEIKSTFAYLAKIVRISHSPSVASIPNESDIAVLETNQTALPFYNNVTRSKQFQVNRTTQRNCKSTKPTKYN